MKLQGGEKKIFDGSFKRGEVQHTLPSEQGNFDLYFILDSTSIKEFLYLSTHTKSFDHDDELADIRVLMQLCINQGGTSVVS